MSADANESERQVHRFIRLTNLIPELLDMVDEKKIAFNPAVELSYLDEAQQRDFLEAMNDTQNAPSLSQAQRLKKLAQEGHFSYDVAFAVMGEEKKDELDKAVIKNDTLRKYFPRSFTPKQMEDTAARHGTRCKNWFGHRKTWNDFLRKKSQHRRTSRLDKNKLPGVDRKRSASGNLFFVSSIFNGIVHLFRLCISVWLTGILWSVKNTIG